MDIWIEAASELEYAANVFLEDRNAIPVKPEETISETDAAACQAWFANYLGDRPLAAPMPESAYPWLRWALHEAADFCRQCRQHPPMENKVSPFTDVRSTLRYMLTVRGREVLLARCSTLNFAA